MVAPGDAPAHQARALEEADVLGDRVERDAERRRDLGHPRLARGEPLENAAASLVRERDQRVVEVHGGEYSPKRMNMSSRSIDQNASGEGRATQPARSPGPYGACKFRPAV